MTEVHYGVHSEVGKLRKVMVCAPGRAHQRLTPTNCDALLFDDVLWVENAKRDHFDFIQKMRDRGVEVVETHNLLTETVAIPEAKTWILDHQVVPNRVGLGLVDEIRSYLEDLSPREPGVQAVSFSYPRKEPLGSSALAYGEKSDLVDFTPAELVDTLEAIKALKAQFPVLNSTVSLEDIQRHV